MPFKEVAGRYDGPALESEVLEFWREHETFDKTLEQTKDGPQFSFSEGPPTANGKPGIHHVLARTFKDVFPRYKTMRGYYVPRKAGWDTHGLPVEHEVEKRLKEEGRIESYDKDEIEAKVGIAEFTRLCRESVMTYITDWEKMTERMGFWVHLEEAYYTLNNSFIESVWYLLKEIWDKDLIYRGYKVVPYDPRIGATLSSHELAQGYKETDDPSITVRFKLADADETYFLVWTTTPWTLPSNLALAVGNDIDYSFCESEGQTLILAEALREKVFRDIEHTVVKTVKGSELVGQRYEQLFDYIEVDSPNVFQVYAGDFVSTEDGTGIVHTAPAYGVDDLAFGQENGLPVVHGVGLDGNFIDAVEPVAGMFFKDADKPLIRILKERGIMFRSERYLHNYPFGWRTGDPILYYAKNAWYIRTSKFRERMAELNQTINWVPDHIKDGRFGKWLENNIDWALSRERFWGTPLPVWTDGEDFMCIGSVEELEALTGRELSDLDLHRPAVDEVTFEKDGKTWRRVPEVIDCWFDSGAMSYAQWHYPFENQDRFEKHFPADFICEAIDQTRGWFYTLHAIATLVSDSVAFKNCICLNLIVDKDGKKMSKSVGNIINPYDVFDSVGADALRWYFLARLAPDVPKRVSVEIVADVASSFINTFWNTYGFFVLYARLDEIDLTKDVPVADRPEIDRWALALLHETITTVTDALDHYDAKAAGEAIESFVDQLSNWYVRRNRRRFWKSTDPEDKQAAYLTLYECLKGAHELMAPFVPFLAENVYQNLVRSANPDAPDSVHMSRWPEADPTWRNDELLFKIEVVQKVVGLGRAARGQSGVRTRQPLSRLLVRAPSEEARSALDQNQDQVLEELNVKAIEFIARDASHVSYRIKVNTPSLGKRGLGPKIPLIRKWLEEEADGADIARAVAQGEAYPLPMLDEPLPADDFLVETEASEGFACAEEAGYLVELDTALSDELIDEGVARELIRSVQDARKQAGLEVSDRIVLGISGSPGVEKALAAHRDYVMAETLATDWETGQSAAIFTIDRELGEEKWAVEFRKA